MEGYNYYTPRIVAKALIDLVPDERYRYIIDICCGSWNLVEEAHEKYSDATCIGVDVDIECWKSKPDYARFIHLDGRLFAAKSIRYEHALVLSNPPFGRLSENERKYDILNRVLHMDCLNKKRYECEMVHSNLLIGGKDSTYLFILPRTMVYGTSFESFRRELINQYRLVYTVDLPEKTFGSGQIRTSAILVKNKDGDDGTFMYGRLEKQLESYCVSRMETKGVGEFVNEKTKTCINGFDVFRGTIESNEMERETDEKKGLVYHCSCCVDNGRWVPRIRSLKKSNYKRKRHKLVHKGDIIVNRIGKKAGMWCVANRDGYISDCIIGISASDKVAKVRIKDLITMDSIDGRIPVPIHGTTAKYITEKDISCYLGLLYEENN